MDSRTSALYFAFFNEIGIISQLGRAAFEARLPHGFTASHFSVLNHLIRVGDGRTPLELARAFQVPKTTMTHTLSGLESHGLVVTRRNPRDGRSKCIWLTNEGRTFREEAIAGMEPLFAAFAAAFPVERIEDLVPRLAEIRQFLDARRDGAAEGENHPDEGGGRMP